MPKTLVGQSGLFASEFGVSCPGGLYCPQRQTVCDRQTKVHIEIRCHRQKLSKGGVRQNKHNRQTNVTDRQNWTDTEIRKIK